MVHAVLPPLLEFLTHVEPLPINVTRPSVMLPSTMVKVFVPGEPLTALDHLLDVKNVTVTPPLDNVPFQTDPPAHQFHVPMAHGEPGLLAL